MKYRSERPGLNGTTAAANQMVTATTGITTPSGPGPAPGGGVEEGISGLLWVLVINELPFDCSIHFSIINSSEYINSLDSSAGRQRTTLNVFQVIQSTSL